MADGLPSTDNPFDQIDPDMKAANAAAPPSPTLNSGATAAPPPVPQDNAPAEPNAFDDLGDVGPTHVSTFGAVARGAEKGILPAAGGLAGAGFGAETGAAMGVPLAPFTSGWSIPVLATVGGIAGAIGGGAAVNTLQDWAVKKLPQSWQDSLGVSDRQARLDEEQHPVGSFMGGLIPLAVTMNPTQAAGKLLPPNATALQHIMAHPTTARMFGGGVMGGMEIGNEKLHGGDIDWRKAAVATTFGMVFNRPNRAGEALTEIGAQPTRSLLGRDHPTVSQAADLKVMGPGVTEGVYRGVEEQAPAAAQTAQENARIERADLGDHLEPDLGAIARQMHPELFGRYEDLLRQRETFAAWHGEGTGAEAAERHLAATNAEIDKMSPEIAAAYRRAADTTGTGTIEPEQFPSFAAMLAAHEHGTGRPADVGQSPQEAVESRELGLPAGSEAQPLVEGPQPVVGSGVPSPQRTIGDQKSFIANDVAEKLIAAGRPAEEARAAGQLVAARYATRAGRFEGKLGSAEELYAREGAAIAGETGRPQASAGAEPKPAAPPVHTVRGRAAADPKTWSLFEFLASNGGLKPTADLHSIFGDKRGPFVPSFGPLLRPGGMALDEAMTRAKEHGYIIDPNDLQHVPHDAARPGGELTKTVNDLHDMIAEESRGRRQYRTDHVQPEAKVNADEESRHILDALHRELHQSTGDTTIKVDPAIEDRVVEIVQKERETDVLAAYERAIMEDHDRFEGLRDARQAGDHISGWDAPNIGAASGAGEIHSGERGEGRVSVGDALAGHGAEPRDVGQGDRSAAETALAQNVDEYFQRIYHGSDYELGAEGKPQALIPGVEPVSQRDLIQAAANKPMAAKKPQKEIGGLFGDSMDQKELFQTARGKIRISPNARPIITLMKDANASTFVHESGHQYLEELMRDANHPDAPMGLRDDAQTVRDWLGVKDDIKTKHHEKFARGFEQYVREGVAPSPELAGVFAKFRNWLLGIYQSIKGLGAEISPEIRNVFDRMLEMEPQRTVVAPERVAPSLLHDIHEAEADHVPPHEAEAAADRIAAESLRAEADIHPEIQHEFETAEIASQAAAQPAGEGGSGAGAAGPVDRTSGGPAPQPSGGARSEEPGKVGGSGTKAAAESAPVQPDARAKLGDHAGTALAPGPTDLFGARESPFTDRAGNIRLDTLNTTDDVKRAIRDSAAENNDFIGDRRSRVTPGQVMELAYDIGMPGAEALVEKHVIGQAYNAEQIVALRLLLKQSAANVSMAAKKFAATGADEDVLAFAQAKDRLQMVQRTVAGVTAEAGRALRAFRKLPSEADTGALEQMIREATGTTLFQLKIEAKLASAMDTPQKMNKFMQEVNHRSLSGMVFEVWINGLLSAFSTQSTNAVSNALFSFTHFGPEKAVASMFGGVAHAVGREGTYTRIGEIGAAARGAMEGVAPALHATGEAFKRGATGLLPGEAEPSAQGVMHDLIHDDLVPRATLDETQTMRDVGARMFGAVRGIPDAIVAGAALVRAGGVEGAPFLSTKYDIQAQTPDIQWRGVTVAPIGTIVRSPGRFLATMDTFSAAMDYSMAKSTIAFRMAADEGLTGDAFARRIADIRDNPSPEVMKEARGTARELTFMDKGGDLARRIQFLTNWEPNLPGIGPTKPLKYIAPFTNVVSRILDQTLVKRTPFGLFSKELQADLSGKNGNIAQDTAAARMMLGSALMLAFGGLASQGYITGSGPKDPREAAIWRLNNQAHSVKIGDMFYQVSKLGPMGMLMGMAADLHDIAHLVHEDKFAEAGASLLHAIVQNVLDQSALQGPAEFIKAVETSEQYGPQFIKSFLSSFVPASGLIGSIAKARDPYIRQTWGIIDAMKAKVPGYSEELHPRIDLWGQPMPTREALGGTGITGIYLQKVNSDPVNKALVDLGIKQGPVEKKIRGVELTPQQYEDFARIAGRMTKQRLDVIVRSGAWQGLAPFQKELIIRNAFKESREAARGIVKMKSPQIVQDSVKALRDKMKKR